MFYGLLILLLDLAAMGGLVIAIIMAAFRLRPSRIATRTMVLRRCTSLVALLAALGLVVMGNVRLVASTYNEGRPTPAQVIGTWRDREGATLHVLPGGTFVASGLPADASDPAGNGKPQPADGHGTWQIVRGDGTWYALFTYSGDSRFYFYVGGPASPRGTTTAQFHYIFPQYDGFDIWFFSRQ